MNLKESHPISIYIKENCLIKELISKIKTIDINKDFEIFFNLFNNLCEIEKHYIRKENQLFPYIEKYGWETTTQYMWTFHDQIREEVKEIRKNLENKLFDNIFDLFDDLSNNILHLILLEETTLFPNALKCLNEKDWEFIFQSDNEVGYMIDIDFNFAPVKKIKKEKNDNLIYCEEGALSLEQINLIFQNLPLDITYVDENDRVVFYNNANDRIFPRSPGIIGREVKFCHPPKSVDTVLKILEEFKNGTKNSAEFWIKFKDKFIHIRFFAIRNKNKEYKGVMEITQDITDIKLLEGEKNMNIN